MICFSSWLLAAMEPAPIKASDIASIEYKFASSTHSFASPGFGRNISIKMRSGLCRVNPVASQLVHQADRQGDPIQRAESAGR